MPEKAGTANKSRILFLLQYLQANTDDDHVIATNGCPLPFCTYCERKDFIRHQSKIGGTSAMPAEEL